MHFFALLLLSQPLSVSPPLRFDPGVLSNAGGMQHNVAITPQDDGWFAVWEDDRMWNRELDRTGFTDWIYGVHVEPDGTTSPAVSVYLAGDTTGPIRMPAITTHNSGLALVYVESEGDDRLALILLDGNGYAVAGPLEIATSTETGGIGSVRAYDLGGGQALIRWDEPRGLGPARINLTTIDAAGAVVRTTRHEALGSHYLIDCTAERCTLLDREDRSLRARDILVLTGEESAPVIVADNGTPGGSGRVGDTVIVLYTDAFNTLCGKRIENGVLLDANPILIAAQVREQIQVAARGQDVLFAWTPSSEDTVAVARIDAFGQILGPPYLADTDEYYQLDGVVWNAAGDRALISGTGGTVFRERDIVINRVEPEGAGLMDSDVRSISQAINTQRAPAVAYGAGVYLVAWEDLREAPARIRAMRFDDRGAALGASIELGSTNVLSHPTVGFDGAQFWVAWSETSAQAAFTDNLGFDIYASRIAIDGALLDANPIAVVQSSNKHVDAELSCTSSACYLSWLDWTLQSGLFSRLLSDGTLSEPAGIEACLECSDLTLAFDGTSLIAVYAADPSGVLAMRRFELDGAPAGGAVVVPGFSVLSSEPLVLAGAPNAAALRVHDANIMRTLLIDSTGSTLRVASECADCTVTGNESGAVVFDGRDFVVAANGFRENEYPRQRLFATRISTAAVSLESEAASIITPAYAWSRVAAASDGRGHTLVVRSAYDEDRAINSARVEARILTNPRVEQPAELDAGVQPDSGSNTEADAGDASINDSGASNADAAAVVDAGVLGPTPEAEEGCACSSERPQGAGGRAAFSVVLCAALVLRKRRAT